MRPEIQQVIQVLRDKIRAEEEEVAKLKHIVNKLFADENETPPYTDVMLDSATSLGALRTDHFYGHTLAEAAKEYLEMRKASGLGSASVNDIYKSLKDGGYKFDTASEEYAKNGVRISLRKNPTIFHKLPGGDYGLCVWYGVKGQNQEAHTSHKRGGKSRKRSATVKPVKERPVNETKSAKNGSADTTQAHRPERDAATSTGGVISAEALEARVQEKNRRMKDVTDHFGVDESTITKLLEPASRVYQAERGWLKIRK
jgi:hypothetical protein